MKYNFFVLAILFVFVVSCEAFAQIPILDNFEPQKGIYKSFTEFKNDTPTLAFDYHITSEVKKQTAWIKEKKEIVESYKVVIEKSDTKEIGFIFGFCDGKDVYVRDMSLSKLGKKTAFYKIEYYGRYCVFRMAHTSSGGAGPTMNANGSWSAGYGGGGELI